MSWWDMYVYDKHPLASRDTTKKKLDWFFKFTLKICVLTPLSKVANLGLYFLNCIQKAVMIACLSRDVGSKNPDLYYYFCVTDYQAEPTRLTQINNIWKLTQSSIDENSAQIWTGDFNALTRFVSPRYPTFCVLQKAFNNR